MFLALKIVEVGRQQSFGYILVGMMKKRLFIGVAVFLVVFIICIAFLSNHEPEVSSLSSIMLADQCNSLRNEVFELGSLVLPIGLFGFNNQLNTLYHSLVFADLLNRSIVEPVFFPHGSCADSSSKKVWAFDEALQWTENSNRSVVSFEKLKVFLRCSGIKEIDSVAIRGEGRTITRMNGYYDRFAEQLGVKLKVSQYVTLFNHELHSLSHNQTSLQDVLITNGLGNSSKLILVGIFGSFQTLNSLSSTIPGGVYESALRSVVPAQTMFDNAGRAFQLLGLTENQTIFVHFRPFPDTCARAWPSNNPKVCVNHESLHKILKQRIWIYEEDELSDYYVAFPPFLSSEGKDQLADVYAPKATTNSLLLQVDTWDCFTTSLVEQSMATLSSKFQGSKMSSWTRSVQIFREIVQNR
jgi:hypothetical protein